MLTPRVPPGSFAVQLGERDCSDANAPQVDEHAITLVALLLREWTAFYDAVLSTTDLHLPFILLHPTSRWKGPRPPQPPQNPCAMYVLSCLRRPVLRSTWQTFIELFLPTLSSPRHAMFSTPSPPCGYPDRSQGQDSSPLSGTGTSKSRSRLSLRFGL